MVFFVIIKCSYVEAFLKFNSLINNLFFHVIKCTKPRESQGFASSRFSLHEAF